MARCVWCGSENKSDGSYCLKCGKPLDGGALPGKCVECGALNALNMTKCGSCGARLPVVKPEMMVKARPQVACRWCGKPASPGEDECWECTRRKNDTTLGSTEKKAGGTLMLGAVLLIIAGLMALLQGILYMMLGSMIVDVDPSFSGYMGCCGFLDVLFGLGGIAGGYFATKRTNFGLVTIGAIVAMLGLGFMIGGLLGLIALVIVVTSRDEFT